MFKKQCLLYVCLLLSFMLPMSATLYAAEAKKVAKAAKTQKTKKAKKDKSKKGKTPDGYTLVIGQLVEHAGDKLVVKLKSENRTLHLMDSTKISYVGFKGIGQPDKYMAGSIVKSNVDDQSRLIRLTYTPPVPPLKKIVDRHKKSARELFEITDENKNGNTDYVEYCTWIMQSHKHMPSKFGKMDKNKDGTLDMKEFEASLNYSAWWKLSRVSPEATLKKHDKDGDGILNKVEARQLIGDPHGNFESIFAKRDKDSSGDLTVEEVKGYLDWQINRKQGS